MTIPVKRLALTSVFISIISTGLIGILLLVNGGPVPNIYKILTDTMFSVIIVGLLHILVLKYMQKRFKHWSVYKTDIWRYCLTFLAACIYAIIAELLLGILTDQSKIDRLTTPKGLLEQLIGASIVTILIIIPHNQVILRQERIDTELELAKSRAANVEAINLVLQQQIQPHFLFNALNTLNSLYKRDYNTGHVYMLHLANFLRATIASTRQSVSVIADEIKMCNDYVAMQKIRFNNALNFNIRVDPKSLDTGYVPSFSLQPLMENAIKHNELTIGNPLHLDLYTEDGYLFVRNNINKLTNPPASSGQGLANLFKRYELLSGDKVQIIDDSNYFTVRLKILNNEHYHN